MKNETEAPASVGRSPFDCDALTPREHALHCFACGGALGTSTCNCSTYQLSRDALANALEWARRDALANIPPESPVSGDVERAFAKIGAEIEAGEVTGAITRAIEGKRWVIMSLEHHEYELNNRFERGKKAALASDAQPPAIAEALPTHIGRLHLSERYADGERMCAHSHYVPAGHPLYWPEAISQYDDSDPYCLQHAIELAESDSSYCQRCISADLAAPPAIAEGMVLVPEAELRELRARMPWAGGKSPLEYQQGGSLSASPSTDKGGEVDHG